jgi:hypothetical protein
MYRESSYFYADLPQCKELNGGLDPMAIRRSITLALVNEDVVLLFCLFCSGRVEWSTYLPGQYSFHKSKD